MEELMPMCSYITIVSGLPRSGTSMMMRMLEKGGIPVITDRIRKPDDDNPNGYYESERVKDLKLDDAWLNDVMGKAVKAVSRILYDLPPDQDYRIIFLRRHLSEVLASQQKMMERRGVPDEPVDDELMGRLFQKHLDQTETWLNRQPNMRVLYASYNDIISDPKTNAERINRFLDSRLSVEDMVSAVDGSLYRQRYAGVDPSVDHRQGAEITADGSAI